MPRDPDRIDPIIAALTALWKEDSDQRLGQLIVNIAREGTNSSISDPFYVEDDVMIFGIEGLQEKEPKPDPLSELIDAAQGVLTSGRAVLKALMDR